ncbi:helix-turn-helix domain-containing protein [Halosolutus gelatinilyticus]|uniref:helix-turn-helix domain-containing protein n=1 Tax=Halosolutus gelatinilyticus TaxID=2931975 RepID=UPI001FF65EF6|nr:helix-turn-helix domain-containing protein [Halosolutus gelatinilyticus]
MRSKNTPGRSPHREILAVLAESQPATISELAASLDAHPITIERHCYDLQQDGYVRQCIGGTFALDENARCESPAAD